MVERRHLAPVGASGHDGHRYEPSPYGLVPRLVRRLRIDPSEYSFVDLGSGKGAVIVEMAALPFRAVIGVEHSPILHEQAVANVAAARRGFAADRVESILCDATAWDVPDGPLVVYLCNPFGDSTMRVVLERLREACALERRPVHLLVSGRSLARILDATSWLTRTSGGWSVDWSVGRSGCEPVTAQRDDDDK